MKKLMFALAAVSAVAVMADAIESANIVGYTTKNSNAVRQPSFGACFVPANGSDTYKLGTLKPTGFSPDDDTVQLINPSTLASDAVYVYFGADMAAAAEDAVKDEDPESYEPGMFDGLVGWWIARYGIGEDDGGVRADNVDIDVGRAFLGLFDSYVDDNDIAFVSSGEAPLASTSISSDGTRQPFFASYIPKQIKLGQIVAESFSPDDDTIQVINPSTLASSAVYVYFGADMAAAAEDAVKDEDPESYEPGMFDGLVGWWIARYGIGEDDGGVRADNVAVNPGDAFLGLFDSYLQDNEITFNFPSSMAPVPVFD